MSDDIRTLLALAFVFAPLSLLSIGGGASLLAEIEHQSVTIHAWTTQREFADPLTTQSLPQVALTHFGQREASALLDLPIASYDSDDCPLCRDGSAAVKPGSRFARSAT